MARQRSPSVYFRRFLLTCTVLVCFSAIVQPALVPGKWFDRIIIFMFENTAYTDAIADTNFKYFASLGVLFTGYTGVTHPSQPNYIAMTSGNTFTTNDNNININASNIADLLDSKGVSWKVYAEDFPGNCNTSAQVGNYYRKHTPFISYDNIHSNSVRCANIVEAGQLDTDLSGTLPQYMYYVPNINNDGHNTNVGYAGNFIRTYMSTRQSKFPSRTLFYFTWDEDDNTPANHIATIMFSQGNLTLVGTTDPSAYNHYSLLRLVEDNWSLGNLGRSDATANAISPVNFGIGTTITTSSATTTTTGSSSSSPASSLRGSSFLSFLF